MSNTIAIAANNGSIGGGEIMLLNIAEGLQSLGKQVLILAPSQPDELASRAASMGFTVVILPAKTRLSWLLALRAWKKKNREVFLWNNGLLPSFATSFMKNRLVHLHQIPVKFLSGISRVARIGVQTTLVPSSFMASRIPGSLVLENWVSRPELEIYNKTKSASIRIGFLGRLTVDKGLVTLVDAVKKLESNHPGRYELIVAGSPKFATSSDRKQISEALAGVSGNLRMLGWASPADFFNQIDVFVCPSNWDEPFGLVLAECMASRIPFVTSTAGALPEVSGNAYKYQVPPGDPAALTEAIEALTSAREQNKEAFEELLNANYSRWKDCFSPDAGKERLSILCRNIDL